jgi:hypothetical protein
LRWLDRKEKRMPRIPLSFLSLRSPLLAGSLALCAALSGCNKEPGRATAALIPITGCDEALDFVRQVALEKMNKRIDEMIERFDDGEACSYYGRGGGEGDATLANSAGGSPSPSPAPPSEPTTGSGTKATTSSGTNNQVEGVDEADFVKNDGKYVYLAQNGVLRIVDGWPAASAHEVSKVVLDGTPKKLFVEGDRALVYVSVPDPRRTSQSSGRYYGSGRECTYGYDCSFTGDGTSTKLEVFDVHDRANPVKLREVFLSGSLIAARRIGNATHTVVADNIQLFPELKYYVQDNLCDYITSNFSYSPTPVQPPIIARNRAHDAYEELREQNRQIILNKNLAGILPSLADSASGGSVDLGTPLCSGLYRAQLLDGASFTTVVSLAIDPVSPPTTATIVSGPGAVYASGKSLYMSVPSEKDYGGPWYGGYDDVDQASSVHKFQISANTAETAYLGSGLIKGRVLNQFAMDEKDDLLRIASTNGRVPDPDVDSQVTVLGPSDSGSLEQLGIVGGIGPKEDIRAVRFDGDQAFVVTFKKTDPLYVIDLKDPSSPRIAGELKIPGFSTYIHMLDATHLLSIGYDADDHGSFAYFDGVLLQIFDISDPASPTLAHRYVIGTRGSSSEALTNHLAFNYFAPLKMLAVPMTICEGGDDGAYGTTMSFSGLMLFNIDVQAGISEFGRVAHPVTSNVSCSNWWTHASSQVKRSIFMDRFVYAISDSYLKVQAIDALGSDLQSIDLQPAATSSSTEQD